MSNGDKGRNLTAAWARWELARSKRDARLECRSFKPCLGTQKRHIACNYNEPLPILSNLEVTQWGMNEVSKRTVVERSFVGIIYLPRVWREFMNSLRAQASGREENNLFLLFYKKIELTRSGPYGSSPDHDEHFEARAKICLDSETVLTGTFLIGLQ
jgi:hypothetical protein